MEAIAKYRNARESAQKVRLVVNQIRGLRATNALDLLKFSNKKAAKLVGKTLHSAVANAEHNHSLNVDELKVTTAFVDEAFRMKRSQARAKGRGTRIVKRLCHITIAVGGGDK